MTSARSVRAEISLTVREETELLWSVAVAQPPYGPPTTSETLQVTVDGVSIPVTETVAGDGTRLHLCRAQTGELQLSYAATVAERALPAQVTALDDLVLRRPSRYAASDELGPTAWAEFGDLTGHELVEAVTRWVRQRLYYVSGSSRHTDGATQTLLARQGVCRDFAHLVIALLRARNVPARLVSVYAPGLSPMDFHAVVEAAVDGEWQVVDATGLAPRGAMVRIATGRDAADTAFLSVQGGRANLGPMQVQATVEGELPIDDVTGPMRLG